MNTEHHPLALAHCDILIIGAGPAGMAAALAAAHSGANIVIVDDNPAPGGQIWRDGPGVDLPQAAQQRRNAIARSANIRIEQGTRVISAPAPHELLLENATRGWRIQWKKMILCTGARELLLPFPGWTLPGVTGAGALQALIKSGMPVEDERIVIAGSGPLLLAAATTASKAGAHVVRIAEQASLQAVASFAAQLVRWPAKAVQSVGLLNTAYRTSSHVLLAQGEGRVESVQLRRGAENVEHIECDRVACGFGLLPNTELGQHLGCAVVMHHGAAALRVDADQATSMPHIYAAGENTGVGGSERALVQGAMAGHAACGATAEAQALRRQHSHWNAFATSVHHSFALAEPLRHLAAPDTVVCRCEDVTHGTLTTRQGWTDAKQHTRCGMGACQGRVCGAATQFLFGWTPSVPRPPLSPARVATLAAHATFSLTPDAHHGT